MGCSLGVSSVWLHCIPPIALHMNSLQRTLGKVVCRQPSVRILGQVFERDLGLAFPYH
jgi:hypothetical protein